MNKRCLFNIVYTIDGNIDQIKLLKYSLNTLLKFNKVDNIYIMHWDIDKTILNNLIKEYYQYNVNFKLLKFDKSLIDQYFKDIKLENVCNQRLRYPSLSRWWITQIIPCDYFWYIDTDILFNGDIRDELVKRQNSIDLMFAFNRKNYYINNNKIFYNDENLNAGVLFINAKLFNKLISLNDILNFYKENDDKIWYVNQSCYTWLFDKFSDLCKIEINNYFNVHPYANEAFLEVAYESLDYVKIFHCNGPTKFNFEKIYLEIMEK